MPGISDIDFIVVFPDNCHIDWTEFHPNVFPDWVKDLFTHPPYCCSEKTWPYLPAWFPTFNLNYLWGQVLSEPFIPKRFKTGCALGSLVDYLMVKIPRDILWVAWESPVRIRVLLAMLHSLKYTIYLANQADIKTTEEKSEILLKLDAMLSSWFKLEDIQRLESLSHLCYEACCVVGALISEVDTAIVKGMRLSGENFVNNVYAEPSSDTFSFLSSWTKEKALRFVYDNYANRSKIVWRSPISFLKVLSLYADESPIFGNFLKSQGCDVSLQCNGGRWDNGLRYHARAMTEYGLSIAQLGVPAQKYLALNFEPRLSFMRRAIRCSSRVLSGKISFLDIVQRVFSLFYGSLRTG